MLHAAPQGGDGLGCLCVLSAASLPERSAGLVRTDSEKPGALAFGLRFQQVVRIHEVSMHRFRVSKHSFFSPDTRSNNTLAFDERKTEKMEQKRSRNKNEKKEAEQARSFRRSSFKRTREKKT